MKDYQNSPVRFLCVVCLKEREAVTPRACSDCFRKLNAEGKEKILLLEQPRPDKKKEPCKDLSS